MQEAVSRAAAELRLSTRQVYNHLARYREERRVSSVLPQTNGVRRTRISTAVAAVIEETPREMWLQPEQPDLAPIVDEMPGASTRSESSLDRMGGHGHCGKPPEAVTMPVALQ